MQELRTHPHPLIFRWARLDVFRYTPHDARRLISAAERPDRQAMVRLGGAIAGALTIDYPIRGALHVTGSVEGHLRLCTGADVAGQMVLDAASIGGDVWVEGIPKLAIGLKVQGNTRIEGDIEVLGGDGAFFVVIVGGVVVEGRVHVSSPMRLQALVVGARVLGGVHIDGEAGIDRLYLWGGADVQGLVIGNDVAVQDLAIKGTATVTTISVGDSATIGRFCVEDQACITELLDIAGEVREDVTLDITIPAVRLTGRFHQPVRLTPRVGLSQLRSVATGQFESAVHLGDRVSIVDCDFRQCGDLDRLDLVGTHLFALPEGDQAKELVRPAGASDGEMASIYRQLRVNLEGKGNRPASAFFYRGEMDSRRRAARQRGGWAGGTEWGWLSLYRLVAGYGLRVAPPLLWFVVAWGLATAVFLGRGLVVLHGGEYVSASWWQAASFALQSMLSVFRPPDAVLGLGTTVLQVVLRILGPILLGLAAFAVRDKVAR